MEDVVKLFNSILLRCNSANIRFENINPQIGCVMYIKQTKTDEWYKVGQWNNVNKLISNDYTDPWSFTVQCKAILDYVKECKMTRLSECILVLNDNDIKFLEIGYRSRTIDEILIHADLLGV